MDVVIDTNVLVSGLLTPHSSTGEVVDMIFSGQIQPVFDDRIILEYQIVLKRKKFSFSSKLIEDFLNSLKNLGRPIIPSHTEVKLQDEKDRCFYECALATESKILVTGNKKHFPREICSNIQVVSPKELLTEFLYN